MGYKSLAKWRDLTDKHLYQPGDTFPFDGREIPAERIAELMDSGNRAGIAVISLSEDGMTESPSKPEEPPRKPVRVRKKAVK